MKKRLASRPGAPQISELPAALDAPALRRAKARQRPLGLKLLVLALALLSLAQLALAVLAGDPAHAGLILGLGAVAGWALRPMWWGDERGRLFGTLAALLGAATLAWLLPSPAWLSEHPWALAEGLQAGLAGVLLALAGYLLLNWRSAFFTPWPSDTHWGMSTGQSLPVLRSPAHRPLALQLLKQVAQACSAPPQIKAATPADLAKVQMVQFNASRRWSAQQGFVFLGEFSITPSAVLESALYTQPLVQVHVNDTGAVRADYLQQCPQTRPVWQRALKQAARLQLRQAWDLLHHGLHTVHCLRYVTEFQDGLVLVSTNQPDAAVLNPPPNLVLHVAPLKVRPSVLLNQHQARVQAALAQQPGRRVRPILTERAWREQLQRLWSADRTHRQAAGWLSRDELHRWLGDPAQANALHSEVQALIKERAV